MALMSDHFKDAVDWDRVGYDSSWSMEASASVTDVMQVFSGNNLFKSPDIKQDSKPAENVKAKAPDVKAAFKDKAMNMKPVEKLRADKVTTGDPTKVAHSATEKTDLAKQNLKEMQKSHETAQKSQTAQADPQSKSGDGVGGIVADTGKGMALAAAADAVAPGTGATVAAVMTVAQGFSVASSMMGSGSMVTATQSTNELSRSVFKAVRGKNAQSDAGYSRTETPSTNIMSGGSATQAVFDKLSHLPGMKTPKFDLGNAECTHNHLDGITKVPFKETPEAMATLGALNDGREAMGNYLHRVEKGVDADRGADVAASKDIKVAGEATVLDNEEGLQKLAGVKATPLNGALV